MLASMGSLLVMSHWAAAGCPGRLYCVEVNENQTSIDACASSPGLNSAPLEPPNPREFELNWPADAPPVTLNAAYPVFDVFDSNSVATPPRVPAPLINPGVESKLNSNVPFVAVA